MHRAGLGIPHNVPASPQNRRYTSSGGCWKTYHTNTTQNHLGLTSKFTTYQITWFIMMHENSLKFFLARDNFFYNFLNFKTEMPCSDHEGLEVDHGLVLTVEPGRICCTCRVFEDENAPHQYFARHAKLCWGASIWGDVDIAGIPASTETGGASVWINEATFQKRDSDLRVLNLGNQGLPVKFIPCSCHVKMTHHVLVWPMRAAKDWSRHFILSYGWSKNPSSRMMICNYVVIV